MTKRNRRQSAPANLALSQRAKVVWLSLLAAMTGVGGLLLAADGRNGSARSDGLALPPLMASSNGPAIESIFRTRQALDRPRWKSIVIHHTGRAFGSPTTLADEHQQLGFRGLGHHFVIGNGSPMDDGELHVGFRWLDQLPGAHAGGANGDWFNQHSISIALVGNGDRTPFSRSQMARLEQLLTALCRELDLPPEAIVLHSEVAPTSDPGVLFPPVAELRRRMALSRP
jgi:hypothetical protein